MAESIEVNAPGPNGDRIAVRVGDKSVGLATRQLPFVLALILVGILGVYRIKTHDATLKDINTHIQALYARQDAHRESLQTLFLTQFDQMRAQLRAQSELVNTEGEQVRAALRENREVSAARMAHQDALLAAQSDEMRKHHAIILWNQAHPPEQHLTLDLPIPHERHR